MKEGGFIVVQWLIIKILQVSNHQYQITIQIFGHFHFFSAHISDECLVNYQRLIFNFGNV